MTKFFQKIRHKLVVENKTSKYFKYAFGEIILVVVGILIALQINNWNETKRETQKREQLILSLKTKLKENQKALTHHLNYIKSCQTKLIKVLNFLASDTVPIQIDTLRNYTQNMFSLLTVDLNTS